MSEIVYTKLSEYSQYDETYSVFLESDGSSTIASPINSFDKEFTYVINFKLLDSSTLNEDNSYVIFEIGAGNGSEFYLKYDEMNENWNMIFNFDSQVSD